MYVIDRFINNYIDRWIDICGYRLKEREREKREKVKRFDKR